MRQSDGKGVITLLEFGATATRPALFSTFLMWLLAELFEEKAEPETRKAEDEPGFFEKVMGNSAVKSFLRSAASTVGREVTRGLFGTRRR